MKKNKLPESIISWFHLLKILGVDIINKKINLLNWENEIVIEPVFFLNKLRSEAEERLEFTNKYKKEILGEVTIKTEHQSLFSKTKINKRKRHFIVDKAKTINNDVLIALIDKDGFIIWFDMVLFNVFYYEKKN